MLQPPNNERTSKSVLINKETNTRWKGSSYVYPPYPHQNSFDSINNNLQVTQVVNFYDIQYGLIQDLWIFGKEF